MYVIIKSSNKLQPNWSGKGWSKLPCKVYLSFEDATDALKSYWFGTGYDGRGVTFIPLNEKRMQKLITEQKARLNYL